MNSTRRRRDAVLMMAYTHYESDARVIREAEAARDGGFEVDFLALRRPKDPLIEVLRGIRLIRLNQTKYRGGSHFRYLVEYLTFFVRCFVKATSLYLQKRYRVIHVNNMPDFLVFSTLIPRLCGVKVILDIHDPMANTFASKYKRREQGMFYRLLLWQERLSAAYSSQVVTVSHPVKYSILVKHGLIPAHITVIANFADEEVFPLRETIHFNGTVRLVFHGTILERSGLRMLMTAIAAMRNKHRISAKIIGEGDFSQILDATIQSLELGSIVEFDNRSYPVHLIAGQIGDCNVGIVPLEISSVTNYALPLKLVEYISMGLPVVCVRNSAIQHYLTENDCLFYDGSDPHSLTAVLDRIADDPDTLIPYRERSVALRAQMTWRGEKTKYVALLRKLAGGQ